MAKKREVVHFANIAVQNWRTSSVRMQSVMEGDPFLRLVYLEALLALYERGGKLPSKPSALALLVCVPVAEIERVLPILLDFGKGGGNSGLVLSEDGAWVSNRRVTDDLEGKREYVAAAVESGRKGGLRSLDAKRQRTKQVRESVKNKTPLPPPQVVSNAEVEGSSKGTPTLPLPLPLPIPLPLPPSGGSYAHTREAPPNGRSGGGGGLFAPILGDLAAAARRSFVAEVEESWRRTFPAGASPPPMRQSDRVALESYAVEGVPVEIVAGCVAKLAERQRVRGDPVVTFGYFTRQGAIEAAVQAWRDGDHGNEGENLSLEDLPKYRDTRLRQLQAYRLALTSGNGAAETARIFGGQVALGVVDRAIGALERASTWEGVQTVVQEIARRAGDQRENPSGGEGGSGASH